MRNPHVDRRRGTAMRWSGLLFLILPACGGDGCGNTEELTAKQLRDPEVCADCHPNHYEEWAGSMHAYAADDPLFLAMNQRGQRETDHELGTFCVQCHAPMAVELGLTDDGLNLADLDQEVKGVTCYFCHQVTDVTGTHNNPLDLAMDRTMRGELSNPLEHEGHNSKYSALHDREQLESSDMCGSCHDIVNPRGVHIERTYTEWLDSLYSEPNSVFGLNCGDCHMPGRDDVAADYEGVKSRRVKDHSMPGVDKALTEWPGKEEQAAKIAQLLDTTVAATVCATPPGEAATFAVVSLDNVSAGHAFPSGASADRRVWVELLAYDDSGELVFESGVVEDGQPLADLQDSNLWSMHDEFIGSGGEPVHMFWDAVDYIPGALPVPVTLDTSDPDYVDPHILKTYVMGNFELSRIEMRIQLRAVGLDVIDDLIESGDLDPKYRDEITTETLAGSVVVWTPEAASPSGDLLCVPQPPATTR